jgi:hypothetical protein
MFTPTARRITRWIVLLPVLMVGSMFYWSLAIGLGGLSLMAASSLQVVPAPSDATETYSGADVGDSFATMPITVHLEESAEPEDVNDNSGAAGFPAADDQAAATPGPGSTSF